MQEGYHCRGEGDCSHSWLDELLCEYVDGTMDPVVRRSFEEYMAAEPQLAEQIERLRRTRSLLCRHGCRLRAPEGLQARVRRRMAWEMIRAQRPVFPEVLARLGNYAAFASALMIVLMAGMLVGAYLHDDSRRATADNTSVVPDRLALPSQPSAMTPLLGRQPIRQPWFVGRTDPVLLSPASARYMLPDAAVLRHPVSEPALQRTGGAP